MVENKLYRVEFLNSFFKEQFCTVSLPSGAMIKNLHGRMSPRCDPQQLLHLEFGPKVDVTPCRR